MIDQRTAYWGAGTNAAHQQKPFAFAIKRFYDICVGLLMLVLFAPLMLLIAIVIAYKDGWGVIYGHERVGLHGRKFKCWKFRTMSKDADTRLDDILERDPEARREWDAYQKLRKDPRIIPGIGERLRKLSLDELPQIWNVIRGDMSIVGARPVTFKELSRYNSAALKYTQMRPGLTGPWQAGERSDGTYASRVAIDVEYFENWSLMGDISITLRTARMMLSGNSSGAC